MLGHHHRVAQVALQRMAQVNGSGAGQAVGVTVLGPEEKTIYSADIWYSRGSRGSRTDVLTAWDSSTLSPAWEVLIPNKRAELLTQRYSL